MHPDTPQLAAYLDDALDATERAELRGHILTCPACAARLEQLRADARLITRSIAASGPAPDVRAAVRARLRRRGPLIWLARGGAFAGGLAGAVAALLLFTVLIGARSSGVSFGRVPDRLFVVDKRGDQLVVLNANDGTRLASTTISDRPIRVRYDEQRDRLYVMLKQAIIAIEPQTLNVIGRWLAPQPFGKYSDGVYAGMILDQSRARLYVSQPGAIFALALDNATPVPVESYIVGPEPGPLALSPDGLTLYALDQQDGKLWTVNITSGHSTSRLLDPDGAGRRGWMVLSPDGQNIYVMRESPTSGEPPVLWRNDTQSGQVSGPFPIAALPRPWDLLVVDNNQLAIPRGDSRIGGVSIIETRSFSVTAQLDPSYDEHNLVAGPAGTLFALNWLHGTITRYSLATQTVTWRTSSMNDFQVWDGVFVRGGWRWPW